MAFDTNLIVVKKKYNPAMIELIMTVTEYILNGYRIGIDKIVDMDEYELNTSSKEVGRYIRVKKIDYMNENMEVKELVKVGTTRYQAFEKFASTRYAFVSISDLGDDEHTVLWYSFHGKIIRMFPEFRKAPSLIARNLSSAMSCEVCTLATSSFSRNSDKFSMYVGGRERATESSKGAMTHVRDTYKININEVMVNVDRNMAIHYAPRDYQSLFKEYKEAIQREQEWQEHRGEIKKNEQGIMIEKKDETELDKKEYVTVLESDNSKVIEYLRGRLDVVEQALKTDPIGSIVYFRMKDYSIEAEEKSANP